MVSQSFHTVKSVPMHRRVQAPPCTRPKVTLSKDAQAALKLSRQEKSRRFKDALDDAWNELDQATKSIAVSHHKSAFEAERRKKNQETENHNQGRGALKSLVHNHRDEYLGLSRDDQDNILAEYAEWKKTKVTGLCVLMKSKINDITQTLKAVENELNSLNCRTGAETILYTTRGSTDLPLQGVTFSTQGVQHFMGSVMGIDNQDFVSKMEGFAVQGMKGAAMNHKQQVSAIRSKICNIINATLSTGDSGARMQWSHYFRNVVQCYQVAIEGWPDNMPFANLSQVLSARSDLEKLYSRWESKETKWKLASSENIDRPCRTHSNKGKKCKALATATNTHRRKKYKSSETVEDSDEEHEHGDEEQDQLNLRSPTPIATHTHPSPARIDEQLPVHQTPTPAASSAHHASDTLSNSSDMPNFYIPSDSDVL
ncbi:hypothetical protein EDB19DRAFT_1914495 [Suillus lakei]|nr:hypothetical protein EDB19DRAFT_1914495 [Suillus lakei]